MVSPMGSNDPYGQRLGLKRARATFDYLVRGGIDASRMCARGYGDTRPIAQPVSAEGRAKNRRVELRRLERDEQCK